LRALTARPAGAVDKRELGRTKSDCGTPKLGVGELDTRGNWLAATNKPDQRGELSCSLTEGHT